MTTLYRIYGEKRVLIYIGITDDYDSRMRQHSEKSWWAEVRGITTEEFTDRSAAAEAEARAIRSESPKYNRTHSGKAARRFLAPSPINGAETRWISIPEAAEYLAVNPKTIRRMISRGEIEAKRFGPRLIRVNLATINASGRTLTYWATRA